MVTLFVWDFDETITLEHTFPTKSLENDVLNVRSGNVLGKKQITNPRPKHKQETVASGPFGLMKKTIDTIVDPMIDIDARFSHLSDEELRKNFRNPIDTVVIMKKMIDSGGKVAIVSKHDNPEWIKRNLELLLGNEYARQVDVVATQEKRITPRNQLAEVYETPSKPPQIERLMKKYEATKAVFIEDDEGNIEKLKQLLIAAKPNALMTTENVTTIHAKVGDDSYIEQLKTLLELDRGLKQQSTSTTTTTTTSVTNEDTQEDHSDSKSDYFFTEAEVKILKPKLWYFVKGDEDTVVEYRKGINAGKILINDLTMMQVAHGSYANRYDLLANEAQVAIPRFLQALMDEKIKAGLDLNSDRPIASDKKEAKDVLKNCIANLQNKTTFSPKDYKKVMMVLAKLSVISSEANQKGFLDNPLTKNTTAEASDKLLGEFLGSRSDATSIIQAIKQEARAELSSKKSSAPKFKQ